MGRKARFALAFAVLLVGAAVAMLCRHSSPPVKPVPSTSHRQPVLRSWNPGEPASPPAAEVVHVLPERTPRAMIRASLEQSEPPPRLAAAYLPGDDGSASRVIEIPDYRLPRPDDSRPAVRIHKVAEGDTLGLLAERYLGSADRAVEIFAANREVLPVPDALPIGVELKIPPRTPPAASREKMLPERPLVPLHR